MGWWKEWRERGKKNIYIYINRELMWPRVFSLCHQTVHRQGCQIQLTQGLVVKEKTLARRMASISVKDRPSSLSMHTYYLLIEAQECPPCLNKEAKVWTTARVTCEQWICSAVKCGLPYVSESIITVGVKAEVFQKEPKKHRNSLLHVNEKRNK